MDIKQLLGFARKSSASDLHLRAGEPPLVRVHGDMKRVNVPVLTAENVREMLNALFTETQRKTFESGQEVDFAIEVERVGRFRVNAFCHRHGEGAVFRAINEKAPTIDELGLPPVAKDLCARDRGLILVTGPTGSGKSTTLAAMIDHINTYEQGHIITIEDPIEYVHTSKNCLITQREVGRHSQSFASALRAALREDPDVILVGELRDLETTALAITAAETGHLVFGTVHTNSAAQTVDRVVDIFPPTQQKQIRVMFAETIEAVISQTLLREIGGGGRVAAFEILLGASSVRNLIREEKTAQILSVLQTGSKMGMQSMDQCLARLVLEGKVSADEALSRAFDPRSLQSIVGRGPTNPIPQEPGQKE
ncbi:MAG: type IV pilus twitching motility protein PilT [Planctomycetes bacterium]|nr:type IV pilus twitching motility protein PilT [Planctomycetota bacterium]